MPSRRFPLLLMKELRDLAVSRAWWLLLLILGPLVGHAFITAVDQYAAASGIGGGAAALAQGLSPLDGVLVPTFGAYDLAVTLLFPFVAIRVIAAEKESGAWKLVLQFPVRVPVVLAAKALAILGGWILAWIPGLAALVLWRLYGGHLYVPELLNLLLGHLLRMGLSLGVAVAAAAVTRSASTAAIVTLAFTVGTWALDFIAAGRGGLLQTLAAYTPAAALRAFEQGQLRASAVLVFLVFGIAGFWLSAIWLQSGRTPRSRVMAVLVCALVSIGLAAASAQVRATWDLSENRRNSFPEPAERALRSIGRPLRVTVYLAAEDPRLMDLQRNILTRLDRVLPRLDVDYAAETRAGLFEGKNYGEVWYEMDGRKVMSRSTTEPIVLETIFDLAKVPHPAEGTEKAYPGYPLRARPAGAAWFYYGFWPLVVALFYWLHFRL